ncbi:MAG: hypothetical protein M1825_000943 [Sarcosagium campestre]|nr:MAG: hypothetical protein M1825_000943 [Sarcosagium campestre]
MSRYANGYFDDAPSRYGEDVNGSNDGTRTGSGAGGGRERRAGGYGGMGYYDSANSTPPPSTDRPTPPPEPPLEPRAGNWRRRPDRGDRDWSDQSRSRERSRVNGGRKFADGPGSKQIDDVLQYIQQEWGFMTEDQCIPVQVALQLMDSSSLGRAHQYDLFQQTHKHLQRALKAIVNEHHQGFNSSIGTFHKIQSSIHASQTRLRTLKHDLAHAKSSLSTTKPELKGLATSSQSYDDMLQILGQIEQLQLIPEKLEARISEKRFLTAVDILQSALRQIKKSEMDNIGALSELKVYLSNQESSLTDILIEELHSHLYLKSPYCQDRWKSYALEQSNMVESDDSDTPAVLTAGRPLYRFLEAMDVATPMVEDASRNPEADSFYYLQLLIEALNKLGRLEVAVNSIEQRLPLELFRVVERTNNEVDQRHPSSLGARSQNLKGKVNFGPREDDTRTLIVSDLLWTLYSKFEAIAEGHRVLHDVIAGIAKRERVRNGGSLTGSFKELWKIYQSEIRSFLHDYLATDGDLGSHAAQSKGSGANAFHRVQRDKTKRMFKLSNIDNKSIEMSTEQEDLDLILKSSVPGLVSESRRPAGITMTDGTQHHDGAATGHKLLIEPSVFNMSLLLPPSLSFIQRLKAIVPQGSDIVMSTLTSFLDDFLVNVFHPQLDETLVELSTECFTELDAFHEDPQWATVARKPIFKGTSTFFRLVIEFCRMLDTIPHDQAFSQLIITQMVTYHEKCSAWFKSLVSRADSRNESETLLKTSAEMSRSGELHDAVTKLWTAEQGEGAELIEREIGLLIMSNNEKPLEPVDIISDRKTIVSLCMLYSSMKWLATKIRQLRYLTDNQIDTSRHPGSKSRPNRRWTLLNSSGSRGGGSSSSGAGSSGGGGGADEDDTDIYLPMTQETLVSFDGVVSRFEELAADVILTLHVEVRCHAILELGGVLQRKGHVLEQAVNDPDDGVLALNADLVNLDDDVTTYLRAPEHRFIFVGVGALLDTLLVANAATLRPLNGHGADRMQLNILVLQQNLKNIETDSSLARAARYFDLFNQGPDAVIEHAKKQSASSANTDTGHHHHGGGEGDHLPFGYDELKTLLELCYSDALDSPRRDVALQAKRGLGDHLLALSEHMWQS